MDEELIQVKVCVAGQGFDGPDLWFCVMEGTQEEIDSGFHYDAAKNYVASKYEMEPEFACDENDSCGPIMMDSFLWDSLCGEVASIAEWL